MGLRDEIRKSIGSATRLGRESAEGGFRAFNDWSTTRSTQRTNADFDVMMAKAVGAAKKAGNDGTHDLALNKVQEPAREPKALHFNPFDLVAAMGYRERPSSMTYQALEMVGRGVPVIADIVHTRAHQVSVFCQLPEDRHSPGFKVRHRDWRTQSTTPVIEKEQELLERTMLYTGYHDPEKPHESTSLLEFCQQYIPDSLIFDQATFEVVPDRKGDPSYITVVDPSTIRLLDPAHRDPGDPFAVQVINGSIVTDFTRDELHFGVRNPRSGIRSYGYGLSEIETLVRQITGLLWGLEYNAKFFSQGSAAKGILNFKGTIPDRHLQAFRRQWYAMVAGVSNAWRTPITNAEELQWINMQLTNRDMEYSAWIDFLIKVCCARYLIAPEEVNFSYGNTGQTQAMGQAPIEEKLKQSKDLGLRPLVGWFFTQLNMGFLQRINPDFEAVPIGLDEKGPEAETDLLTKMQASFMTVNEARERVELPALADEQGGQVIMNPTWLQYVQGQQAAGGDFGDGDTDDHFEVEGDEEQDPFGLEDGEEGEDQGNNGSPPGQQPAPQDLAAKSLIKAEIEDLFDVVDNEALKSTDGKSKPDLVSYTVNL